MKDLKVKDGTIRNKDYSKNIFFILLTILALIICACSVVKLYIYDVHDEYCSHIILVPLISGYLFYIERKSLFNSKHGTPVAGTVIAATGVMIFILGSIYRIEIGFNDYASIKVIAAIIVWVGGFIYIYGLKSLRRSYFPFFFLILMVPIPNILLDALIWLLNAGTISVTYIFFKIAGIQFRREGMVFYCRGVDIVLDRQCSGIRSFLGIMVPCIFTCYLFLKTYSRRTLLIIAVLPVIVVKNGLRILILSLIAINLNPQHKVLNILHLHGGILFAVPAVCILGLLLLFLIKSERRRLSPNNKRMVISSSPGQNMLTN